MGNDSDNISTRLTYLLIGGGIGVGHEDKVIVNHIANLVNHIASIFGTASASAAPATGESMCLIRAAAGSTAASRSSGPSTMPPTICGRSAIFDRIAPSIVAGMRVRTVSTAQDGDLWQVEIRARGGSRWPSAGTGG